MIHHTDARAQAMLDALRSDLPALADEHERRAGSLASALDLYPDPDDRAELVAAVAEERTRAAEMRERDRLRPRGWRRVVLVAVLRSWSLWRAMTARLSGKESR